MKTMLSTAAFKKSKIVFKTSNVVLWEILIFRSKTNLDPFLSLSKKDTISPNTNRLTLTAWPLVNLKFCMKISNRWASKVKRLRFIILKNISNKDKKTPKTILNVWRVLLMIRSTILFKNTKNPNSFLWESWWHILYYWDLKFPPRNNSRIYEQVCLKFRIKNLLNK